MISLLSLSYRGDVTEVHVFVLARSRSVGCRTT